MANNANNAVAPAQSAVAQQAALTIGGKPAIELQDTIFTIGQETVDAELLMSKGEDRRATLDANLHDIIKGLPYVEFVVVRDFYKAGIIDQGKSDDAAQKIWERAIGRLGRVFEFKPPKAESKDAERMAKKRQEEIEKLAAFDEYQLQERRETLLAKGDNASLREATKINNELERRNKDEIDADKAKRKMMVEQINKRVRELSKAATHDADELLAQVLCLLG